MGSSIGEQLEDLREDDLESWTPPVNESSTHRRNLICLWDCLVNPTEECCTLHKCPSACQKVNNLEADVIEFSDELNSVFNYRDPFVVSGYGGYIYNSNITVYLMIFIILLILLIIFQIKATKN